MQEFKSYEEVPTAYKRLAGNGTKGLKGDMKKMIEHIISLRDEKDIKVVEDDQDNELMEE